MRLEKKYTMASSAALFAAAWSLAVQTNPGQLPAPAFKGIGKLWQKGPPSIGYFSDRPEGQLYTIRGQGYGIAWGSVLVGEAERGDLGEWYHFVPRAAVWWNEEGAATYASEEPVTIEVEGEVYSFVAAAATHYLPERGVLRCQAYCVEFYEWLAANPGEDTSGWTGKRYAVIDVPITPPWADFNADGAVDTLDFNSFLNAWAAGRQ